MVLLVDSQLCGMCWSLCETLAARDSLLKVIHEVDELSHDIESLAVTQHIIVRLCSNGLVHGGALCGCAVLWSLAFCLCLVLTRRR